VFEVNTTFLHAMASISLIPTDDNEKCDKLGDIKVVCMDSKHKLLTLGMADVADEKIVAGRRILSSIYNSSRTRLRSAVFTPLNSTQRGRATLDTAPYERQRPATIGSDVTHRKLRVLRSMPSGFPQIATRLELSSDGRKLAVPGAAKAAEGAGKPLCRVFDMKAASFGLHDELPLQKKRTNLQHLLRTSPSDTSSIKACFYCVSRQQDDPERHRMSR
jgi:hypothetical protein